MKKDFNDLFEKFKIITKKRWIESVTTGNGNIGLTFEHEIGKKIDSNPIPDFKDIEIKCTTRFSRFPISLFSLSFDGPTNKEIIRLNNTYGNFAKDFYDKKTLIKKLRVGELFDLNNKYFFSLCIENDKLYLCVFDEYKTLIEKESYVYIDNIKKHLLTKLKKLAIIKASKKNIDNKDFFRYYEISFFILKNFETFMELLLKGEIEIEFVARIQKNGIKKGKYRNKNLVFQIKKQNIEKLFDKIFYYNLDSREYINKT